MNTAEASAAAGAHASDIYFATLREHGKDWSGNRHGEVCRCGFPGKGRYPRRSVGLHVAAAERRADKQWRVDYDAKLAELRKEAR